MASILQQKITAGTLKGYYDFRSGTADDFVAGLNNGTVTAGVFNREGLQFNGTTSTVQCGHDPSLDVTNLSVFTKFNTSSLGATNLIGRYNGGANKRIWRVYLHTDNSIKVGIGNSGGGTLSVQATSTPVIPIGEDTVVGFTFTDGVGVTKIYINGVSVAFTGTQTNTSLNQLDNDQPLEIGSSETGTATFFNGTISAAVILNEVSTETEAVQITAELNAQKWSTKPKSKTIASQPIQQTTTANNTCQWDLEPKGAMIVDLAEGRSNGTISGKPVFGKDLLGNFVKLAGGTSDDWINVADTPALDDPSTAGAISLEAWFKNGDVTQDNKQLLSRNDSANNKRSYSLGVALDEVQFSISADGSTIRIMETTSSPLLANQLHHIIVTYDGSTGTGGYVCYVDGTATALTEIVATGDPNGIFATDTDLRIGAAVDFSAATKEINGTIWHPQIHSRVIGPVEAAARYKKGADLVQYKTDWGTRVSDAAVSAGFLEDTDWQVNSGSFKVSTDTINGEKVKVFECVTTGEIYIPWDGKCTAEDAAYGTWDVWVYKTGTSSNFVNIFNHTTTGDITTGNNYNVIYRTDGTIDLRKETNAVIDGGATVHTLDNWYKISVTRRYDGLFEFFFNGVSIGTASDTTYTTATYWVFDMDAGDKIVIADKAITKYLGVI